MEAFFVWIRKQAKKSPLHKESPPVCTPEFDQDAPAPRRCNMPNLYCERLLRIRLNEGGKENGEEGVGVSGRSLSEREK